MEAPAAATAPAPREFRVAVIGQTGVGKSALIRACQRNQPDDVERPAVHNIYNSDGRGTTKSIIKYQGDVVGNKRLVLFDTMGIGDSDTPITKLTSELEARLYEPASLERL